MWACTAEWARVLKPSGSMFVLLGDEYHGAPGGAVQGGARGVRSEHDRKRGRTQYAPKRHKVTTSVPNKSLFGMPWRYAIGCVDRLGLIHRAEMIWHKPNPVPESVADRVVRAHETVFHFTRDPQYWHDPEHARLPSVWTVPTTPLKVPVGLEDARHFAAMLEALPRRPILGYAPPLGIVLDPFGGTGTTAAAAKALGRVGISADTSPAYTQLAAWRSQMVAFGPAGGITAGATVGDRVLDTCPRVCVLVQERGGNVGALNDGADSHTAAVAAEPADGCCHAVHFGFGLRAAGRDGGRGVRGLHAALPSLAWPGRLRRWGRASGAGMVFMLAAVDGWRGCSPCPATSSGLLIGLGGPWLSRARTGVRGRAERCTARGASWPRPRDPTSARTSTGWPP